MVREYFVLGPELKRASILLGLGPSEKCSYNDLQKFHSGVEKPDHRIELLRTGGHVADTVVWCSMIPFITTDVWWKIGDKGLSGLDCYDVNIVFSQQRLLENYVGLSVIGRCGPVSFDPIYSERVERVPKRGAPRVHLKGLYFDESTWDGSDFFMPNDGRTSYLLLTERAASIISELSIRGISLSSISEAISPLPLL